MYSWLLRARKRSGTRSTTRIYTNLYEREPKKTFVWSNRETLAPGKSRFTLKKLSYSILTTIIELHSAPSWNISSVGKRTAGFSGGTGELTWHTEERSAIPTRVAAVNPVPKSPVSGPAVCRTKFSRSPRHVSPHLSRCIFQFGAG